MSTETVDLVDTTGTDTTATLRVRPLRDARLTTLLAPAVLGAATIGLWQLAIDVFDIDPFIVPSPGSIWSEFLDSRSSVWHCAGG